MRTGARKPILIKRLPAYLLAPEDSSPGSSGNPPSWATPGCLQAKTLLWVIVSVAAALLLGQL